MGQRLKIKMYEHSDGLSAVLSTGTATERFVPSKPVVGFLCIYG